MKEIAKQVDFTNITAEILKLKQYEPVTNHFHAKGMYARTVFSPAGVCIVGKVHKTEHFYCVLSGIVRMVTNEGTFDIDATKSPQVLTCKVGMQRAVYIIKDAWRMNVHLNPNDITDLDELEKELVEPHKDSPFLPGNILKNEVLSCAS